MQLREITDFRVTQLEAKVKQLETKNTQLEWKDVQLGKLLELKDQELVCCKLDYCLHGGPFIIFFSNNRKCWLKKSRGWNIPYKNRPMKSAADQL